MTNVKKTSLTITPTVYPYLLQFTVTDQWQKDKTIGNAQIKVHQQWLTKCQKDKTSGSAQIKVHQQWLTNVKRQDEGERTCQSPPTVTDQWKKTRRVGAQKLKSTNSVWPMSKRQDEWKHTSQSPPTVANQCQKRQDEWERTSQCPPTVADQCEKDKTSGSAQVKVRGSVHVTVHQQWLTNVKKTRRVGECAS